VDRSPPQVRAARASVELERLALAGHDVLVIGGGEPLLEPYIEALVAKAKRLGIGSVRLETNATRVDGTRAKRLRGAGLDGALVALNALDSEVADSLSNDPGGLRMTARGVASLLRAGVDITLAVALLPENRGALVEIVSRAASLWPMGPGRIEGVVARHIATRPDGGAVLPAREAAAEITRALVMSRTSGLRVRVAPEGELPPCAYVDPIGVRDLLRLGEDRVAREGERYMRVEACDDCDARCLCPGVLPEIASTLHPLPVPSALRRSTEDRAPVVPSRSVALADDALGRTGLTSRARWCLPAGHSVDREATELALGMRHLIRREVPDPSHVALAVQALEGRGFFVRVVTSTVRGVTGRGRVHVFAASDVATLDEAAARDEALDGTPRERQYAMRWFGLAFGYPGCCVDAFVRADDQDDGALVARMVRSQRTALRPEQNWAIVPVRLFSHLPCRPDCEATAVRAAAVLRRLRQEAPAWTSAILVLLAAPALVWSFERFLSFPGGSILADGSLRYDDVVTHAVIEPGSALLARESYRRFEAAIAEPVRGGARLLLGASITVVGRDGVPVAPLGLGSGAPPLLRFDRASP